MAFAGHDGTEPITLRRIPDPYATHPLLVQ